MSRLNTLFETADLPPRFALFGGPADDLFAEDDAMGTEDLDADREAAGSGDCVDSAYQMLDALRQGGSPRSQKLERLRRAIKADAYDNELKLSIAVDRLLDRVKTEPGA